MDLSASVVNSICLVYNPEMLMVNYVWQVIPYEQSSLSSGNSSRSEFLIPSGKLSPGEYTVSLGMFSSIPLVSIFCY